ncbi:hypothetical protein MRX96_023378 [Rhipicephalus microplus]
MSSAQREPLNIEFSESTEFERWQPLQKEISQEDLPESLVIEDDLHSFTDPSTPRPHCDNSVCIVEEPAKAAPSEAAVENDSTMPSTVSFTYTSTDPKSSDGCELESFSFKESIINDPMKNSMAKKSHQAPQATEPSYPFPVFPTVPDLRVDISQAIVASQSDKYRSNTNPQSLGVYQDDRKHCVRHSQLASDDFNDYYTKMLSAKKTQSLQEPPLCSSCSQSMMQYVSAIQTLIQQLSVDIIVKGKDPPDCSWCAREKLASFQKTWVPPPLGGDSSVVANSLDHKDAKHPTGLHNRQANTASPEAHAWQCPESTSSMPVPYSISTQNSNNNNKRHSELLYSAEPVQNFPDNGKFHSEGTASFHSQPPSLPAGQVPDMAVPMNSLAINLLSSALVPTGSELSNVPKQDELSLCAPQLPEVQYVISPENGLSPATSQCNGGVVEPSKSDEVRLSAHFTESGELLNLVKRPSELQLHNLGSNVQENQAGSGLPPAEHSGVRRKSSLSSDWMTDLVQPLIPEPAVPSVQHEAYVTMANNDLSAMLCLVLGNSLWLSKTSRSLVVLVTDGVSHAFRHLLSCVFNVVLSVRSLGTQGTTKLALLEQPDIGVSYTKLHAWRLTQFSKCIFLDAGMLVVQNCDELFERDELSAVPDIGWPDCFNSGLFVYVPSMETFWDLISFAERQGSFDGGDQGLLNTYFRNWSSDINRRLPFIYNLMANVCYTYKPAFRQFGRNVKVVQFLGGYKPWNVKFHPPTGTLSPAASVHPTYAQFVQFWIQIFVKRVLPLFSLTIQNKVNEQRYTCALDILQHFPSFLVAEPVAYLPAPSLRTHPKPILYLPPGPRTAPESTPETSPPDPVAVGTESGVPEGAVDPDHGVEPDKNSASVPAAQSVSTVPKEKDLPKYLPLAVDDNCNILPEVSVEPKTVNDLSGMLAWEQGRADYMGEHCSDNIMAKLDELIGPGILTK